MLNDERDEGAQSDAIDADDVQSLCNELTATLVEMQHAVQTVGVMLERVRSVLTHSKN